MYYNVKTCVKYKRTLSNSFTSDIGLKLGDPSLPLIFMLFVNDLIDNIDSNLSDIFTVNELKLFLILFADDQVLFVKFSETLQSMLNDVENYCIQRGLKLMYQRKKQVDIPSMYFTYIKQQ
jgi:hypothetical protein